MKKSSQNNRSALLMAGQNSLSHIDPDSKYYNYNNYSTEQPNSNQMNKYKNQQMYQSTVKQVYKREQQLSDRNKVQFYNKDDKLQKQIQAKKYGNTLNRNQNQYQYQNSRYNYPVSANKKYNNLSPQTYKNQNNSSLPLQTNLNNNSLSIYPSYNKNVNQNQQITVTKPKRKNDDKLAIIKMKQVDPERIKKLMMKLTFVRLRKIQALARGFLVRRKVYPKLLQQFLIAKSVLSLIQANVVYRQISTIIMQTITFPKYQTTSSELVEMYKGKQQILQDLIYDSIVTRVIQRQMKPIVQQSVIQRGKLMNRPQITFGFNLRDPLELILYQKLISYMNKQLRDLCNQSINEYALDRRQLFIIDQWIEKYAMVTPLYEQIASQLLQENIGEYIVNDICSKVVRQAVFAISESTYNKAVNDWYMSIVEEFKAQVQQIMLEQAFGQVLVQMGYGIQKQKHELKE